MVLHSDINESALRSAIKQKFICFGGNRNLKIYGTLNCAKGKRMKKSNRVFFANETDAITNGYRPCGHCMREAYQKWKAKNSVLKRY